MRYTSGAYYKKSSLADRVPADESSRINLSLEAQNFIICGRILMHHDVCLECDEVIF